MEGKNYVFVHIQNNANKSDNDAQALEMGAPWAMRDSDCPIYLNNQLKHSLRSQIKYFKLNHGHSDD